MEAEWRRNTIATTMAKLSGIRKALSATPNKTNYPPDQVGHYFTQAATHVETLRKFLPDLYGDFHPIQAKPETKMMAPADAMHYSRSQIERLSRDIDQIFEIRANSELEQPKQEALRRVFITHGRSDDWRRVQAFIEKDVQLPTIELAQEPNIGRTIIEKLEDNAARCDSVVIVMTGDDVANEDKRSGSRERDARNRVLPWSLWSQERSFDARGRSQHTNKPRWRCLYSVPEGKH